MITIRYKGNNQVVTPTIFPDGTSQVWKIENIEQYQDKEVDIIWNFEKDNAKEQSSSLLLNNSYHNVII